ncbi:MAG: hypothetical protein IJG34_03395 [Synergistaceae bacterium]|nr:hypothetical protein [Synergistaceae bacterium]MBQ3694104.1 hypothetical protein [Synergistaceae bacterium]MBQ9629829.1 hypothetical protein [Synergistaceae bacterium]MBR0249764.1 hypothetical protein [Synergistaceae bacterium]
MNLIFPELAGLSNYKSPSQRIRVLSEYWFKNEMYCPACGCDRLIKLPNNSKLADFFCKKCGEIYELKSKGSPIGKSLLDGAYYAALERITSSTNPNLFVLQYQQNIIIDLTLVPKHFFTPNILKIRRALSPVARRAGYTGSLIMYSDIPEYGKIAVVKAHTELNRENVMNNYAEAIRLRIADMNLRGWLMDIMKCIDKITHNVFSLDELYAFTDELRRRHPDNHNVTAKIRQQLQFLRDKGFLEFLGGGRYKKI